MTPSVTERRKTGEGGGEFPPGQMNHQFVPTAANSGYKGSTVLHQYCFKASVEFALTPPFHRVDIHKGCRRATYNQRPIKLDYFRWLFVHVVESL